MNSYRVALIPGDGIGVDVVNEGCKVLDAVGKKFETQNYDLGESLPKIWRNTSRFSIS